MGVMVPSSGRISRPWRGKSRSRIISGRSSETTYEKTENLNPGIISSVTAAPPRTYLRSSTRTFLPACARYAAFTKPLWPPPITMTSYRFAMDLRDETCGILRAAEVEAFYKRQRRLTTRNLTRLDCESDLRGWRQSGRAFYPTMDSSADRWAQDRGVRHWHFLFPQHGTMSFW